MGNTSGNQRHKSAAGLIAPSSPTKEIQSQAFVFDKNSDSNESNSLYAKNASKSNVRPLAIGIVWARAHSSFALPQRASRKKVNLFFFCAFSERISQMAASRDQCRPTTPKIKCCLQYLDGKAVANKCLSAERFLNGNPYRWFKGKSSLKNFCSTCLSFDIYPC